MTHLSAVRRLYAPLCLAAFLCLACADGAARGQIIAEETTASPAAPRYGGGIATRYRVGAKVQAKGGTVRDIRLMVAVPLECPEQQVQVVEEDFSPHIGSVDFRTLPTEKLAPPGARQMLIAVPELPPRQEAHALVTYEVVTKAVLPPENPSLLKIPAKPPRWLKPYLSGSPYINVDHRKIRDAVREALASTKDSSPAAEGDVAPDDEESAYQPLAPSPGHAPQSTDQTTVDENAGQAPPPATSQQNSAAAETQRQPANQAGVAKSPPAGDRTDWQKVEAIYDYVQDHVKYEEGAQDKPALEALQDGKADCHGIAALFVAMCRTAEVPARMVWVDGHQYAEFYLEEAPGQGYWYPVQSAGTWAFGEMPSPKVILQKGDNFRVPERRRERLRYASDYTLLLAEPQFKPKVAYVREQL
ncbi:MAG: hypothetical protein IT424_16160 [Pirellulales bacterium]|nr:hypothetical protein [Pirellulales bacterium]